MRPEIELRHPHQRTSSSFSLYKLLTFFLVQSEKNLVHVQLTVLNMLYMYITYVIIIDIDPLTVQEIESMK